MRVAVIDSTPLISLVHLELAGQLSLFFDRIYVPRAVQREVNQKQRFRYRLQKLYRAGVFERCASADPYNVELLQADKAIDEGEAEGLVQGQEKAARYFIGDEQRAREISEGYGLTPVGTIRLLARLNLEGEAEDTEELVRKLRRDLRFRVTEKIVADAIALAPKAI